MKFDHGQIVNVGVDEVIPVVTEAEAWLRRQLATLNVEEKSR